MSKPEPHLGMHFETYGKRYYQRRTRHASGSAEWHSRSAKARRIHKAVFASGNASELAIRLKMALDRGEHD